MAAWSDHLSFFLRSPPPLECERYVGVVAVILLCLFICVFFLLHNKLPPPPPTEWLGNSKHLLSHNSWASGTRKWFIWVVGLTSCTQCYLWLQSSECLIGGWKIRFQVLISGHWQEAVALHYSICSQHVNFPRISGPRRGLGGRRGMFCHLASQNYKLLLTSY